MNLFQNIPNTIDKIIRKIDESVFQVEKSTIVEYEFDDHGTLQIIKSQIYDAMNFDEKNSLWQIKPIFK